MSSAGDTRAHGMRGGVLRTWAALLAIVAWSFGTLLLPALHLARHQDDHIHLANGAIVRTTAHRAKHAPKPVDPKTRLPFDHGSGALAHFGSASMASPTSSIPLEPFRIACAPATISIATPVRSSHQLSNVLVRGPPSIRPI